MSTPAPLSLAVRKEIRDLKPKCDEVIAKIVKVTGIATITWDVEADMRAILARPDSDKLNLKVGHVWQYANALATLLERQCADEMIKEAIVEEMSAGKIGVRMVDDVEKFTAPKYAKGMYNGALFEEGGIFAITEPQSWIKNVSQLEQFKLEKIL